MVDYLPEWEEQKQDAQRNNNILPEETEKQELASLLKELEQKPWGVLYAKILGDEDVTNDPWTGQSFNSTATRILYAQKWLRDYERYVAYIQEDRQRRGVVPLPEERIQADFQIIKPSLVTLRGTEFRRYGLASLGLGQFKRANLQLYMSNDRDYQAADLSVRDDAASLTQTLAGDDISYLEHEMFIYAHLQKLFEDAPSMRRHFLHFYGKSVDAQHRAYLSLERALGYEGHTDLMHLLNFLQTSPFRHKEAMVAHNVLRHAARCFLTDAFRALQFLHEHNIVLYDFKPENIFLHEDIAGPHAKLADFGGTMHLHDPDLALQHHHLTTGYHDEDMIKKIDAGLVDARSADLYAAFVTIENAYTADRQILPGGMFDNTMRLPWKHIYDKTYPSGLLSDLIVLFEKSL